MPSRSSRRKNAAREKLRREHIEAVLREGVTFVDPNRELLAAIKQLKSLRLIEVRERSFSWCSESMGSWSHAAPACSGKIYLSASPLCCTECNRDIDPDECAGRVEHAISLSWERISAWVQAELRKTCRCVQQKSDGVFVATTGAVEVFVCIADMTQDSQYSRRNWAAEVRTCYIVVDTQGLSERFLKEEWLTPTSLSSLLSGETELSAVLGKAVGCPIPAPAGTASIPIYSKGIRPLCAEPPRTVAERRFVVQVLSKTVRINGIEVVTPRQDLAIRFFACFGNAFLRTCGQPKLRSCFGPSRWARLLPSWIARATEKRLKRFAATSIDCSRILRSGFEKSRAFQFKTTMSLKAAYPEGTPVPPTGIV